MPINFMLDVFKRNKDKDAIVWRDELFNYKWLLDRIFYWKNVIKSKSIKQGSVTIIEADFSPNSIALFLALVENCCIIVPLTSTVETKKREFIEISQGEVSFSIDEYDESKVKKLSNIANHELYDRLKKTDHPGIVLFSSGSTGESKAVVHNLTGLLEKFHATRHSLRTITFLLYDHIGGVNTMLYTLANAGCIVTVQDRSPDSVLRAIEKYKVELLPTSPTFINLILLSEAYKRYDVSSLKTVTYGTEPMLASTLKCFHELFPKVTMLQTYGLSEVGILRSKSKSSDSLWVKIGGEGFNTRIVGNILQIKAKSAMLGYLNAPSPFTKDGWLNTEDLVEVDGEYIRFLGRKSDIINVGGEKVFPAEVESIIQEMENVADVIVHGEKNPIIGNIVCATVTLQEPEESGDFNARLKVFCRERLQPYKIPVKVKIVDAFQHSERFKRMRQSKVTKNVGGNVT